MSEEVKDTSCEEHELLQVGLTVGAVAGRWTGGGKTRPKTGQDVKKNQSNCRQIRQVFA